jgi:hypothetical protein
MAPCSLTPKTPSETLIEPLTNPRPVHYWPVPPRGARAPPLKSRLDLRRTGFSSDQISYLFVDPASYVAESGSYFCLGG